MSADLQDLYAAIEVGSSNQSDGAAFQSYSLHLHAVGHHGNWFVTGFVGDASLSPVLLELQVTHMQNTPKKHVTFHGAGRAHNWNNLSAIFPELLRAQKDIAEFRERD